MRARLQVEKHHELSFHKITIRENGYALFQSRQVGSVGSCILVGDSKLSGDVGHEAREVGPQPQQA